MSNTISFGKYEGQTYEWLFFNDPTYVEWMYDKRIHRQERHFDEEQGEEFAELYRRAKQLRTRCRLCSERQATRISMSLWERSEASNHVGFYCNECKHVAEGLTVYMSPSFFVDYTLSDEMRQHHAKCIKNVFIGHHVPLTQAKMEEFFHNDANFVRATPGYFAEEAVMVR